MRGKGEGNDIAVTLNGGQDWLLMSLDEVINDGQPFSWSVSTIVFVDDNNGIMQITNYRDEMLELTTGDGGLEWQLIDDD